MVDINDRQYFRLEKNHEALLPLMDSYYWTKLVLIIPQHSIAKNNNKTAAN